MTSLQSDDDLVLGARAGSQEAFGALVERYRTPVVRFAHRLTRDAGEADDVAQETFLRAYRGLATFRPERPFARWLFAIARNVSHDALRRTSRCVVVDVVVDTVAQPGPEEVALQNAEELTVRSALEGLPDRYRAVLELYYLRGFLYREIAQSLGIPIGTVKTYIRRAKVRMRDELATAEFERAA